MDLQQFQNQVVNGEVAESRWDRSLAFPVLMRKVYTWMALALAITGLTSWFVANSPGLISTLFTSSGLIIGLCIVELVLVVILSAAINKLSLTMATLMFVVYSVLNGVTLASIFLVYTAESITKVFFITAGTFAAMAAYGYFTKKDLTSWGKILLMALIGVIIASIVNIFMKSSMLSLIVSYAGVLVFVGLTAYDSQKIKKMLTDAETVNDTTQKIALMGSLMLYLDFINLFLHLLRILGDRR